MTETEHATRPSEETHELDTPDEGAEMEQLPEVKLSNVEGQVIVTPVADESTADESTSTVTSTVTAHGPADIAPATTPPSPSLEEYHRYLVRLPDGQVAFLIPTDNVSPEEIARLIEAASVSDESSWVGETMTQNNDVPVPASSPSATSVSPVEQAQVAAGQTAPINVNVELNGREVAKTIIAHAAPALFPREYFDNPQLTEPTPLKVSEDGHRIFGHVALRGMGHIGLPQYTPPPEDCDFSYFHRRPVETTAGPVNTGPLCLFSGHLNDLQASLRQAQQHYDDPRFVTARGCVGYDEFGTWFSGAVMPHVNPDDLAMLASVEISGDWRPINNRRELVGICAVAMPGFPIVQALAASAANNSSLALVGAGIVPRHEIWRIPFADMTARMNSMQAMLNILKPLALERVKGRLSM